jgi:hypothetical protein
MDLQAVLGLSQLVSKIFRDFHTSEPLEMPLAPKQLIPQLSCLMIQIRLLGR